MLSRQKRRMFGLSAIAIVSLGAISYDDSQIISSLYSRCACNVTSQSPADIQACKHDAHTSWYAWLSGESSSAQFHYLDLLELLLGSKESSSTNDGFTSPL
ncbi:hypothetical protein [Pseudoalteromonas citrea]|uniref:Uncharacterized protein n=1 Tax=Pseudoalteromonas citrea DSM 8771 TaxID=1117314 RepID=U1KMM1_9GAMM|nr:hypothetical protein [Pseudoalteromonas citrea]